ncbi:MAG: tetratricopeptide repeat protein [Bacteroidales bacterium]|nr:tetratricopeptide repeat protein [Bacteroidales bacterium]MBP5518335.1 tetratricopeptide repeat protein [Bacteroidales bacterium]
MRHVFSIFSVAVCMLWSVAASWGQDLRSIAASDSCMIEATLAFNRQNTEKAADLCRKALEFNSRNDAAYYMLAKLAIGSADYLQAEKHLKSAAEIDSANYYYMATLGAIYLQNNDIPSAIKLHESLIKRFPSKPDSYVALINLYTPRGQSDKALELADKLEKAIGPNEQSTMARFKVYTARREHQKAIDVLAKADEVTPNQMYETYIADLYAGLGKDSLALAYYSKALEIDPDYIPALYGKMETFRRYKNYPLYLAYLKSFLSNRYTDGSIKKAHLEEVMKDPVFYQQYRNEMAECIQEYAASAPADSAVAISGAIMLSRYGEFQKAGKVLDGILKYYPEDAYIRRNMMSFLYSTENWERLESFSDSTMALFPDQAVELFQFKAFAELNQKKFNAAIQTLLSQEKAVKKLRDTSMLLQIYSLVGDMYHSKNDDNSAFKYYEKALKLDSDNPGVLNNYAWYLATGSTDRIPDKKTLRKALSMAKTAVEKSSGESHYLDTYAWVLFLNGDVEEAKKYMQQAVAYGGVDDSGILTRYSDILASLKEYDLAMMYYKKALLKAAESGNQAEVDKISARIEKTAALQKEDGGK